MENVINPLVDFDYLVPVSNNASYSIISEQGGGMSDYLYMYGILWGSYQCESH